MVRVGASVVMMHDMSIEQEAERRALLEGDGAALFREVVEAGVLPATDPRLRADDPEHARPCAAHRPRPAAP